MTIRLIGIINLGNAGDNTIINSHDANNSHNLTNNEDENDSISDTINTNNILFNTFLNNEVETLKL